MHSPAEGLLVPWLMLSLLAQHTGTLWGEQGGLALTQVENLGHLYIMSLQEDGGELEAQRGEYF